MDVNLSELAQGAFMEKFNKELQRVLDNIGDPNTEATKTRKITLTATITPDENREIVDMTVQVQSKIVPDKSVSTKLLVDKDSSGKMVAAELKSRIKGQTYFDRDGNARDDTGKVLNIKQMGGK